MPLPPGLCAEVRRTTALLAVVESQIAEVEAERDRIVARAVSGAAPEDDGGRQAVSGAAPAGDGGKRARSGAAPEGGGGKQVVSGAAPKGDGGKQVVSGAAPKGDGGKQVGAGAAPKGDGGKQVGAGATPEDDGEPGTMIARLVGLRGVGANDAVLLAREVFCRGFRNRRELAGWAGLAPASWAGGKQCCCIQASELDEDTTA